jgi:hypothetical protein
VLEVRWCQTTTPKEATMTVTFNHTIVYATDKRRSAKFLANVLGLPERQAMVFHDRTP